MISDENWEKFTDYMFKDAFDEYLKTDFRQKFEKRHNEILDEIFDKESQEKITPNKINHYLNEFSWFGDEQAKVLYIKGLEDMVSFLKKLEVL